MGIIILSFLSAFTLSLGILTLKMALNKKADGLWISGFGIGILFLAICLSWKNNLNPSPSAIDVYRGNTELQITYQNSTPIDTIVVFKEE